MSRRSPLPPAVRKEVRRLLKDRRDALRMRLPCEVCLARATGQCATRKHWVCDDCFMECCQGARA